MLLQTALIRCYILRIVMPFREYYIVILTTWVYCAKGLHFSAFIIICGDPSRHHYSNYFCPLEGQT